MSVLPPRGYATIRRYPVVRRPTFIPRAPLAGGTGAGLGGGAGAGGLAGLLAGIALPLLCLGCLASLALLGLFATMIAAAVFMNRIQQAIRRNITGAGTMVELNMLVLFCALFCSVYVLMKHRRGVGST